MLIKVIYTCSDYIGLYIYIFFSINLFTHLLNLSDIYDKSNISNYSNVDMFYYIEKNKTIWMFYWKIAEEGDSPNILNVEGDNRFVAWSTTGCPVYNSRQPEVCWKTLFVTRNYYILHNILLFKSKKDNFDILRKICQRGGHTGEQSKHIM